MTPIESYLAELENRLKRHIHADKVAEHLKETEAHLRACAEEHGEEGAIIRYGTAKSVASEILRAHARPERTILATVLIIVSPIVIAMMSFVPSFAPQLPIWAFLVPAYLALGAALVGLLMLRGWRPIRVTVCIGVSSLAAWLLAAFVFASSTHADMLVPRWQWKQYENYALANRTLFEKIKATNWDRETTQLYVDVTAGDPWHAPSATLLEFGTAQAARVARQTGDAQGHTVPDLYTVRSVLQDSANIAAVVNDPASRSIWSSMRTIVIRSWLSGHMLSLLLWMLTVHTVIAVLKSAWSRRHRLFPPRKLA